MANDKDTRTYVRIHDGMPDHPKVDGLSDAAFRLLITMWCWCSRHLTDGLVPAATWGKRGTQKARDELVAAGLVDLREDGSVAMHDYTDHQRTAEEVRQVREARSKSGEYGNHVKWHVKRGNRDPECEYCSQDDPESIAQASQTRSQTHRKKSLETETETEVLTNVSTLGTRKRATQLPVDWKPNDTHLEIATEYGLDPAFELKAFKDHHEAKGSTFKNWDAAFRTWLNKSRSFKTPAYSAPSPVARKHLPESAPDHIDPDDFEAYAAFMRGESE